MTRRIEDYPDIGCFPRRPDILHQEGWIHVNRRPDQQVTGRFGQEIPVCPNFQLIEICSALVGTGLAEQERFCGQMGKHEDSIGPLSGFRGMRYEPRSTCSKVHDALSEQLELMEQNVDDEILSRWQQVIFDNCVIPARPATVGESKLPITIREEDPHFRRIESQSDLTPEEVVSHVKSFLMALREITGTKPRFNRGALNCPQAPQRYEVGMHS